MTTTRQPDLTDRQQAILARLIHLAPLQGMSDQDYLDCLALDPSDRAAIGPHIGLWVAQQALGG